MGMEKRKAVPGSDSLKESCRVQIAAHIREDTVRPGRESNHNSTRRNERPSERQAPHQTKTARAAPYFLPDEASANLASLEGVTVRVYHGIGDGAAQPDSVRRFALDHAAQHGQLGAQHIAL